MAPQALAKQKGVSNQFRLPFAPPPHPRKDAIMEDLPFIGLGIIHLTETNPSQWCVLFWESYKCDFSEYKSLGLPHVHVFEQSCSRACKGSRFQKPKTPRRKPTQPKTPNGPQGNMLAMYPKGLPCSENPKQLEENQQSKKHKILREIFWAYPVPFVWGIVVCVCLLSSGFLWLFSLGKFPGRLLFFPRHRMLQRRN